MLEEKYQVRISKELKERYFEAAKLIKDDHADVTRALMKDFSDRIIWQDMEKRLIYKILEDNMLPCSYSEYPNPQIQDYGSPPRLAFEEIPPSYLFTIEFSDSLQSVLSHPEPLVVSKLRDTYQDMLTRCAEDPAIKSFASKHEALYYLTVNRVDLRMIESIYLPTLNKTLHYLPYSLYYYVDRDKSCVVRNAVQALNHVFIYHYMKPLDPKMFALSAE